MKTYDHDNTIEDSFTRGEYQESLRARRLSSYAVRCSDRMCGALDCPNCHPEGVEEDQ